MKIFHKLDLTPRLQCLADWVPVGSRLLDVGTDHGYLPIWLLLNHRISRAIASDLREGPLSRAKKAAEEYGVSSVLTLRLCDGLAGVDLNEIDTIVIAGMGGENIATILKNVPQTTMEHCTLLLQPMTRAEILRAFLMEHEYQITRERLVRDRGILYPVMEVHTGSMHLTKGQLYGGARLLNDPLEDRFLIEQIVRLQIALGGLNQAAVHRDETRADELREVIAALAELREEWRHANCEAN